MLAQLPDHFTRSSHAEARQGLERHLTFVAQDAATVVGFITVDVRGRASEILVAAVDPTVQRRGVGSRLLSQTLDALRAAGVVLVEVKTLDASADHEPYVATRAFWERRGFVQIDRIDPLPGWDPGNPAAIYVRALGPTEDTPPERRLRWR